MATSRTCLLLAMACFLAFPSPARGDGEVARARQFKAQLQYSEARSELLLALRAGTADSAERQEIYRLLGEVSAGLGLTLEAEEYFRYLLAVDPSITLPTGASPKLSAPFEAARAFVAEGGSLTVRHRQDGRVVTLVVASDSLAQVAGLRVRYHEGKDMRVLEARGVGEISVAIPGKTSVELTLLAIDSYGNEIKSIRSSLQAEPETIAIEPVINGEQSLFARWELWGGAALSMAAVGAGFGLAANAAQDDLDGLNQDTRDEPFSRDFDDAMAQEERGRRWSLVSNISFAVSGAAAVTAIIMAFWGGENSDSSKATLELYPENGQVGASMRFRF